MGMAERVALSFKPSASTGLVSLKALWPEQQRDARVYKNSSPAASLAKIMNLAIYELLNRSARHEQFPANTWQSVWEVRGGGASWFGGSFLFWGVTVSLAPSSA